MKRVVLFSAMTLFREEKSCTTELFLLRILSLFGTIYQIGKIVAERVIVCPDQTFLRGLGQSDKAVGLHHCDDDKPVYKILISSKPVKVLRGRLPTMKTFILMESNCFLKEEG